MVKKMTLGSLGGKRPDITTPSQLREQARLVRLGRLRERAQWWQILVVLAATILLITAAAWFLLRTQWASPNLDSSKYQVVFLESGKVFFGKMQNSDGEYITLQNAYYTKAASQAGASQADQTALIKVGSEAYGPENDIQIARSKIEFWQNLRNDSQVVQAIKAKSGS